MSDLLFLVLWVGAGIIAYGFLYAHMHGLFPDLHPREATGLLIPGLLFAPIMLIVSLCATDFCRHGWMLYKKDKP